MRVSENTASHSVGEAVRRTRGKMEKLQIQNATQKKILTPSDDPAANTKIMDIRTETTVNSQFENNAQLAKTRLSMAFDAMGELYDLFVRAKEIAINQSSDGSASADSRLGVAQEVGALYKQLISIANRRVGQHYLFGGFKTLTQPYNEAGQYSGDNGEIPVEVQKDVFIKINIPGNQIFEIKKVAPENLGRTPAEAESSPRAQKYLNDQPPILETVSLFQELDALRVGLITNDTISVRHKLEKFDEILKNVTMWRTKLSSRVSGIDQSISSTQNIDLKNAELATQLEDADFTELWSNLAKEETVLRSSLHAAQKLLQPTLLDFLR